MWTSRRVWALVAVLVVLVVTAVVVVGNPFQFKIRFVGKDPVLRAEAQEIIEFVESGYEQPPRLYWSDAPGYVSITWYGKYSDAEIDEIVDRLQKEQAAKMWGEIAIGFTREEVFHTLENGVRVRGEEDEYRRVKLGKWWLSRLMFSLMFGTVLVAGELTCRRRARLMERRVGAPVNWGSTKPPWYGRADR